MKFELSYLFKTRIQSYQLIIVINKKMKNLKQSCFKKALNHCLQLTKPKIQKFTIPYQQIEQKHLQIIRPSTFSFNPNKLFKFSQTNFFSFSTLKQGNLLNGNLKNETSLDPKYTAFQISEQNFPQILKFISRQFVSSQPMSSHIKINQSQLTQFIYSFLKNCCKSGLSYGIKTSDGIVAARMACQYENCVIDPPTSENGKILVNILTKIEQNYKPENPKNTLNIFVTATHKDHLKKGLYQKLVEQSEKQWRRRGFNQQYASCTGIITANMLTKMGYQQIECIHYQDFVYEGKKPFAGIQTHKTLKLMARKWK